MRRSVQYVIGQVQALVGDPRGQFATPDRLFPLINHAQDQMILNIFRNETVSGIEGIVVVPNVAAGATSLAPFFEAGQALEGLLSVSDMKERKTGGQDDQWTPMAARLGDLPTTRPNNLNVVYK